MEPVVSNFTREYHEAPRQQVQVFGDVLALVIWRASLEMHGDPTFEAQTGKDFLKWRMGIDMGWNSLPRQIVIKRQLIIWTMF